MTTHSQYGQARVLEWQLQELEWTRKSIGLAITSIGVDKQEYWSGKYRHEYWSGLPFPSLPGP